MSSEPLRPDCPKCEGSGSVPTWNLSPENHSDLDVCPDCHGEGTIPAPVKGYPACRQCRGAGSFSVDLIGGGSKMVRCPFCVAARTGTAPTEPAPAPAKPLRWRYPEGGEDQVTNALATPAVVLLMVGAPGAGKSAWLEMHAPEAEVCSADRFFYRLGGFKRHAFDPERLSEAHESCLMDYVRHLRADRPMIAVDNTNLHASEFAPYIALALAHRYHVVIVRIAADAPTCFVRNQHGVPATPINRMVRAFEAWQLPPHWERDSRITQLRALSL